jgi:hypothetical protein
MTVTDPIIEIEIVEQADPEVILYVALLLEYVESSFAARPFEAGRILRAVTRRMPPEARSLAQTYLRDYREHAADDPYTVEKALALIDLWS